jgi:predicted DNA-binding antitoxin AbrB/MazE fold protein
MLLRLGSKSGKSCINLVRRYGLFSNCLCQSRYNSFEDAVGMKGVEDMTQTVEAIYEHGTFRLLESPHVLLQDGQHVRLTVETEEMLNDLLTLAEQVYAGLSDQDIDDIERIALDRQSFFTDRP